MIDNGKEALAAAMAEIHQVLNKHIGGLNEDPHFLLQKVIGQMLVDASYSPHDLSCNNVEWSLDTYVAAKVGPLWPRFLALHQFLAKSGATPENPFNFQHCDRYGVAFANEEKWKSMALQTQNYTYLVVLQYYPGWKEGENGKAIVIPNYIVHLRICTKGHYLRDLARTKFSALKFLTSHEAVYPEIGYGDNANDYFRYKDGRDQGYLCTIEPSLFEEGVYSTKDVLVNYKMLEYVIFDLASHCDCLEDYKEEA